MDLHLLKPIVVGGLELRNRIAMAAMETCYADSEGYVTERSINHYISRAKGGVGLIIVEIASVDDTGRSFGRQLGIHRDDFVPKLKELARAIKESGQVKCFIQLHHAGRRAPSEVNKGTRPVAPSPISIWGGEIPRKLSSEKIGDLIEAFALASVRAKKAEFDGIELHCAHGYLISQFLSPLTNKRTDIYGGDLESRSRFLLEILERIRQKVGQDYPIIIKISGSEFSKGGFDLSDSQKLVRMLERFNIAAFEISAGYKASSEEGYINASIPVANLPMAYSRGYFVHLAEGIKKVTKVPVIAVGRLDDPSLAEKVIAEGKADLISIARGLLADPLFPSKLIQGKPSDIRPCIACNTCPDTLSGEEGLRCAVNGASGKEKGEYQIKRTNKPKKVLVVGGGPGGIEAARIAGLRGHRVTLVERKQHLGGNLIAASAVSFKKEIRRFVDYLSGECQKAGVEIHLNYEFDEEKISAFNPEVIILATGASFQKPIIPGINLGNVADAVEVLEGKLETGPRVVVVGGGMIGCEVAVFLAEKGKEVILATRRNSDFSLSSGLAPDMEATIRRWLLFELWPNLPITVVANAMFKEVKDKGLVVLDREAKTRFIGGDTVVFAIGMTPNNELSRKLHGKVPELYSIGDCVQPRQIIDAIHEATRISGLI